MKRVNSDEKEDFFADPRQKVMWKNYLSLGKPTFGNAYRSAVAAGYSEQYSLTITNKDWFKNLKRRIQMLPKAERALEKALEVITIDEKGREQADLLRVQVDAAKFVAKTLGKDEGYSERQEVTGKDGSAIVFMPVELIDKYKLKKDGTQTSDEDSGETGEISF